MGQEGRGMVSFRPIPCNNLDHVFEWIERLHMMSHHSKSLANATAAILVHDENLSRVCTKMAAISMAKRMHYLLIARG